MFLKKRFTAAFALVAIAAFVWYVNLAEAKRFVTNGLVSFWTFNQSDIVGNTLKDVWGKNDGTIEGDLKVVEGRINEALEFNGNGRVEVPHDSSIDFPDGPFSIELWLKGSADIISQARIFNKGGAKRYELMVSDIDMKVLFMIDDDVTKTMLEFPDDCLEKITDESWHHWVCVRDTKKGKLCGYMDGEEVATCGDNTKNSISSGNPLWLGTAPDFTPLTMHGTIDELRIYNRALSKEEIKQNYNVTAAVSAAFKLAALWGQLKSSR